MFYYSDSSNMINIIESIKQKKIVWRDTNSGHFYIPLPANVIDDKEALVKEFKKTFLYNEDWNYDILFTRLSIDDRDKWIEFVGNNNGVLANIGRYANIKEVPLDIINIFLGLIKNNSRVGDYIEVFDYNGKMIIRTNNLEVLALELVLNKEIKFK